MEVKFQIKFCVFDRAQRAEETLEKITNLAYTTMARGLLERDRFIFALLLAIEVGLCVIILILYFWGITDGVQEILTLSHLLIPSFSSE